MRNKLMFFGLLTGLLIAGCYQAAEAKDAPKAGGDLAAKCRAAVAARHNRGPNFSEQNANQFRGCMSSKGQGWF